MMCLARRSESYQRAIGVASTYPITDPGPEIPRLEQTTIMKQLSAAWHSDNFRKLLPAVN